MAVAKVFLLVTKLLSVAFVVFPAPSAHSLIVSVLLQVWSPDNNLHQEGGAPRDEPRNLN